MSSRSGKRVRRPDRKLNVRKCKYFQQGSCLKGADCEFLHDPSQKQETVYHNPNDGEANEGEEEFPFSCRSDLRFVVGHRRCSLQQLQQTADNVPVRIFWQGSKMFLGGSQEQNRKFKHGVQKLLSDRETGYMAIPEGSSVHYIIGRQGKTLKDVSEATNTICMAIRHENEMKLEIMAYTASELEKAKLFLKAKLMSQAPISGSILCFDTANSTEGLRITFKPYKRYRPINVKKRTAHELCLAEDQRTQADADTGESILMRGLQHLSVEETMSGERTASCGSKSRMPPCGYIQEENVLFVRQWTEDHLKELEKSALTIVPKLEARFGKVLWTDLPPEIATNYYTILEFEQEQDLKLKTSFATFADSDLTKLTDGLPSPHEVESYDLKVVSMEPRGRTASAVPERRIDLRVVVIEGRFHLVAVFGDESQKSCADWICLDGKFDFRISISARKILPLEDVFQRLVDTLQIEDGECISYRNTPELSVHYIRHKKKRCYPLDDYCIAVYDIQEFDVDQCGGITSDRRLRADFKSIAPHQEIELQNRKWMGRFYATAGHSLEEAMAVEQCLPPEDVSGFDEPWETSSILSDLPEFLEHVHSIGEILTSGID